MSTSVDCSVVRSMADLQPLGAMSTHRELLRAYKAAQHLVECLEVAGLTDEVLAARSIRRRLWHHMSGEAYVSHTGRLVRP